MSKFPVDAPIEKVIKAFERLGFRIVRQGNHISMVRDNPDGSQTPLTMPNHRKWRYRMEIYELVMEMKLLERRLTLYEEKYGVLSEDFYKAYTTGELSQYDEYDETRTDFSRWKGIYETWLRRKAAYTNQIKRRDLSETLRVQPAY
jgi:predicted RNA binding protein YcfA (HicA-like mRNA interferase family)